MSVSLTFLRSQIHLNQILPVVQPNANLRGHAHLSIQKSPGVADAGLCWLSTLNSQLSIINHQPSTNYGSKSFTVSRSCFNSVTVLSICPLLNSSSLKPSLILQLLPSLVSGKPHMRPDSMP